MLSKVSEGGVDRSALEVTKTSSMHKADSLSHSSHDMETIKYQTQNLNIPEDEQEQLQNDQDIINSRSLDLKWSSLTNVEYLTDGGNTWIHTACVSNKPVVVKTLKPECQDVAIAINEIESELEVHCKIRHKNIVEFCGAGTTTKGMRFLVMERLDGGTLTQLLGYDTRIRDRRRRCVHLFFFFFFFFFFFLLSPSYPTRSYKY